MRITPVADVSRVNVGANDLQKIARSIATMILLHFTLRERRLFQKPTGSATKLLTMDASLSINSSVTSVEESTAPGMNNIAYSLFNGGSVFGFGTEGENLTRNLYPAD